MAIPVKWGAETLANSTTSGDQEGVTVTALENGGFVMVWTDRSATGADTDGSAVRGRIFDAMGNAVGSDFVVNTTTADDQGGPDVVAVNGGFVATWSDHSVNRVVAQLFDMSGARVGGEIDVNPGSQAIAAKITALDTGGFAVTWMQNYGDSDGAAVLMRRFDADGVASSPAVQVNTIETGYQGVPKIAAIGGGKFVVIWEDYSNSADDPSDGAIRMQIYNDNGTPSGAELLVNTATGGYQVAPEVIGLGNGKFIVSWADGSGAFDQNVGGVTAQMFDENGAKIGTHFGVNGSLSSSQGAPALAHLGGESFIAAFNSNSDDYDQPDIAARTFSTDFSNTPTPDDQEFRVNGEDGNPATFSSQLAPSVTRLADGRVVVAWQDDSLSGGDLSGNAIHFQILDPRGGQIIGTEKGEALCGKDAALKNQTDTMFGLGGDDFLFAFAGGDTLDGGAGKDIMTGGLGDDMYKVDRSDDQVVEAGGEGIDHVFATASFALKANVENLTLGGTGAKNGIGNTMANTIIGNEFANKLSGNAGNDTLTGNGGSDTLDGGLGIDTMRGGKLHDIYVANSSADKAIEKAGEGTDTVKASVSFALGANIENLTMIGATSSKGLGNTLNNTITGNAKTNTLDGGAGNDTLKGMHGNDVLIGGAGKDVLTGGLNDDIFRFVNKAHSAGAVIDTATDFDDFGNDRIDVSALFGPKLSYLHDAAFNAAGQLRINDVAGADVVVEVNTGGSFVADFSLRLKATTLASMTASDFVL